jgi:hypothetical protein
MSIVSVLAATPTIGAFAAMPSGTVRCRTLTTAQQREQFKALLARTAKRFPSRQALARALGINGSRLSRAINTGDFPFNVKNCLKLAQVSGESPSMILRTAGKDDVATLIESLYGDQQTADVRRLLTLDDDERDIILGLLRKFEKTKTRDQAYIPTGIEHATPFTGATGINEAIRREVETFERRISELLSKENARRQAAATREGGAGKVKSDRTAGGSHAPK